MAICKQCFKPINKRTLSKLCNSCCQKGKKASIETRNKLSRMRKGIKKSEKHKKNISLAKKGEKNPNWKGDKVGYEGVHSWIKRNYKKPALCQSCNKKPVYDLANISGNYIRNINDWEWICRKCHMLKDGRLKNFKKNRFVVPRLILTPV